MKTVPEQDPFYLFTIENITVPQAPLLKSYYWESLGIDSLNEKLRSSARSWEHCFQIPTRQVNTKPLKVLLWMRNNSDYPIDLNLKRIKNCNCMPLETRVGFNQFRRIYHCPHRRLIHILKEVIVMDPGDLVPLSVTSFFFLFGEHKLSYEMTSSDSRVIQFHFHLDIIGFDPIKCILTRELIPVDMKEFRRFIQPIWVRNITIQNLKFNFTTRERGFKIINPELTVPRQSVWPLMVEYRPTNERNELQIKLACENSKYSVEIMGRGYNETMPSLEPQLPIADYDCSDFLYVIYPNQLNFVMELGEERSLMVCIHNYNQKCMEFRWQTYVINELFEISFEPNVFRLKPHHSKLCLVIIRVFGRPIHFQRIPTVLEVHRILDRSTKIAKDLLTEIESIDDPKWKADSYLEHVFLQINLKVNMKKEEEVEIIYEPPPPASGKKTSKLEEPYEEPMKKKQGTTIFEKLFWEYLSESTFMRDANLYTRDDLSYDEVLELHKTPQPPVVVDINVNVILRILSQILAEALGELSKNWRFIPPEFAEDLN